VKKDIDTSDEAGAAAAAVQLPTTRFEGEEILIKGKPVADAIRTEEVPRRVRRGPSQVRPAGTPASLPPPRSGRRRSRHRSIISRRRAQYSHGDPRPGGTATQTVEEKESLPLAALLQDLRERDSRDATRSVAPLKHSPGARLLDTTSMSAEQAAARIVGWYRNR
jgi:cytidylate kinase